MNTETVGERAVRTESLEPKLLAGVRRARTLKRAGVLSGVGLHTGNQVDLRLVPAEPGFGIQFCRTDLPHRPMIPAHVSYVSETVRCTTLQAEGACIHTVEHVLSALWAMGIDNAMVEISENEPPAAGGCARLFVDLIEELGTVEQLSDVPVMKLSKPIFYTNGSVSLVALPSPDYRISYTLDYPGSKAIGSQFFSTLIDKETFAQELAPCRTFALYEELSALMDAGLIKGGSLDSAVVIKDDEVLTKGGLHFPNEMARHKVLDLVGDLALTGIPMLAHIIAIRSGHAANVALAQKLYDYLRKGDGHEQQ